VRSVGGAERVASAQPVPLQHLHQRVAVQDVGAQVEIEINVLKAVRDSSDSSADDKHSQPGVNLGSFKR